MVWFLIMIFSLINEIYIKKLILTKSEYYLSKDTFNLRKTIDIACFLVIY